MSASTKKRCVLSFNRFLWKEHRETDDFHYLKTREKEQFDMNTKLVFTCVEYGGVFYLLIIERKCRKDK